MGGKQQIPTSDLCLEDPTSMNSKCQMTHTKQYIYSLIVSFGCVCAGTVLAWTSSVLPHITTSETNPSTEISVKSNFSNSTAEALIQLDTTFHVTDTQAGFVGSIVAIGAVVGALPAGYFVKKMGIKLVLMTMALLFSIGWIGTMFHTLETILLGRFVGGIATGTVCVCVPIYVSEIADVQIRGILGSFFQVSFCFGILLVNLVGGLVVWSDLSYWMIACPFAYFIALTWIPTLRLHQNNVEEHQLKEETYNNRRRKQSGGFWDKLRMKNNAKALVVGLGLVTFQQLSGVNAVIFYTGGIFSAAGSTISANLSTVIVTAAQLVISVVSAMCIEKFNRRLFLLISAGGMSLSLIALAMYFLTKPSLPGSVPLVSLILFFFCYCAGYGPLPWLMMGEIFSAEFKSAGCSIATTFNWLLVFAVTSIFPILCSNLGEGYTFLLFALFNALAMVFTWSRVPETRGKTSEEIQMRFFNQ